MAAIHLIGITKSYGDNTVLRGLSLTVNHGECFTLLGPSGCGKTVLLRIIAGFERPDAGSIRIGEQIVSDAGSSVSVAPNERSLGMVFQDYAVWPHMSVFNNIAYPLKLSGISGQELRTRVMEAVEQVNLGGFEDRMPSQLSGGQQQRVALARALAARPSLLLLDEPLCNLDASLREEMRFEIKELQKNLGITIFYITHDQEIALAISDRLAIMDEKGVIRQIGTPDEIYEQPADRFVFRFMGMANFLPVRRLSGGTCVAEGDQAFPLLTPTGETSSWLAGFRPSDVCLARNGDGLRCLVKRASFLGAMMDYLIEVDGVQFRTQIETSEALNRGLMFNESETCKVSFRGVHWFNNDSCVEGRQ
jgi:iron(III) transport system ATP-binding protein